MADAEPQKPEVTGEEEGKEEIGEKEKTGVKEEKEETGEKEETEENKSVAVDSEAATPGGEAENKEGEASEAIVATEEAQAEAPVDTGEATVESEEAPAVEEVSCDAEEAHATEEADETEEFPSASRLNSARSFNSSRASSANSHHSKGSKHGSNAEEEHDPDEFPSASRLNSARSFNSSRASSANSHHSKGSKHGSQHGSEHGSQHGSRQGSRQSSAKLEKSADDLSEKETKRYQQMFDRQSVAGRLDLKGFKVLFRLMGEVLSAGDAQDMFHDGDTDDNGTIEFSEFCRLYSKFSHKEQERKEGMMQCIDKLFPGGDGEPVALKKVEKLLLKLQKPDLDLRLVREKSDLDEKDVKMMVRAMDTDGNGRISKEEFVNTLCQHMDMDG